ncbi:MAG: hypothetical protein JW797_20205 [Bradymonadales bacterium]|nr:hypothetical protein [Bradymonadales bacterium]
MRTRTLDWTFGAFATVALLAGGCGRTSIGAETDGDLPEVSADTDQQEVSADSDLREDWADIDDEIPACRDFPPLGCGARAQDSTSLNGRLNEWDGYNCTARAESGPEVTYAFRPDEPCQIVVRLTDLEVDLDLLLLPECDAWSCTAASSTPMDIQTIETVSFQSQAEQIHYIVVDGYDGASGRYTIQTDCLCGSLEPDFADGEWVMQVDRRWNGELGDIQLPTDPLEEEDYEPVEDGASYTVLVSGGWEFVSIGDTPLVGRLTATTSGYLWYDITDGAFAGGRFLVWVGEAGLQAELTLYGSGLPIVASERGALVSVP